MPFQKVQPEKLSDGVVRQIELLILRGILRQGERLPSERELAQKLGVSRPSLRAAISELTKQGLLATRAGAGIYVADVLGSAFSPGLTALFSRHEEALFDYLDFRTDMEAMAAERAARLASRTDLQVIGNVFARMEKAHEMCDTGMEATLDAEFHMAIIEASHNVIMLHMMRSVFELTREGVLYNRKIMFRQKTTRETLLNQHKAILDAITARQPEQAREAVRTHLGFVKQALLAEQRFARNEAIARQKYARVKSR